MSTELWLICPSCGRKNPAGQMCPCGSTQAVKQPEQSWQYLSAHCSVCEWLEFRLAAENERIKELERRPTEEEWDNLVDRNARLEEQFDETLEKSIQPSHARLAEAEERAEDAERRLAADAKRHEYRIEQIQEAARVAVAEAESELQRALDEIEELGVERRELERRVAELEAECERG